MNNLKITHALYGEAVLSGKIRKAHNHNGEVLYFDCNGSFPLPYRISADEWQIVEMEKSDMTIQELCRQAHETAVQKKWWENDRNIGEVVANIHSEVTEGWEEWRAGNGLTNVYYKEDNPSKPLGFPTEMADIMIRVADLCEAKGIDLVAAIKVKMDYNKTRPERHGGKLA